MTHARKESRFKRLLRAYRCHDLASARRSMGGWYQSNLGSQLLDVEKQALDQVLPNLFGYHLLQVGLPELKLAEASRVSHCMVMDHTPPSGNLHGPTLQCLYAETHALPLASDSLDVLMLPHTLEFETNPHQLLREAERTLIPEGHVVIIGFNPWSLWGLWRLAAGWRERVPWCGRFFSLTRLKDWLALLGFDTIHAQSFFFRPPLQHPGIMRRLGFLERAGSRWWSVLGGSYVLVARKRVATLTPIRPRWRSNARFVPGRISQAGLRREGQR